MSDYDGMTVDDLEERITSDLLELSQRFKGTSAEAIGSLFYRMLIQVREAFRTAKLVVGA